jgi:hypothetical protein
LAFAFACSAALVASPSAIAAEPPIIVYKPTAEITDTRPYITQITAGAQRTDLAFIIDFNKEPYGEGCGHHCANATVFVDTDDNPNTGLRVPTPSAPESGADLVFTIQGFKEPRRAQVEGRYLMRVRLVHYAAEATSVDHGTTVGELTPVTDPERVRGDGRAVFLLLDGNMPSLSVGPKMRVIYHPMDSDALVGQAKGIKAPGTEKVELFIDGKIGSPSRYDEEAANDKKKGKKRGKAGSGKSPKATKKRPF